MAKRIPKQTHRIQFKDECPAIGSGWRGIAIKKVGWKWVSIVESATGHTGRMSRALWDEIPKRVVRRGKVTDEVVF